MATLPQFKQRQIARRGTSDIDRLANQYKSSVDAISGQYQTAFTGYQAGVAEKMKPFEAQMANYQQNVLPTYEAQKNEYQKKLDDYQKVLADLEANPVTSKIERVFTGKTWYGKKKYENVEVFTPREIPTFTEKAPELEKAPEAPKIEEFDSKEFEAKSAEAGMVFERESGERKSTRLGAMARRTVRPLLSGAKA
jgi:carboxypeptidase C (cathepsin A)